MFTDKEHRGMLEFSEELGNLSLGVETTDDVVADSQIYDASDNDLLLSTSEKEESKAPLSGGSAYSAPNYDNASSSLIATDTQPESLLGLPTYNPQSNLAIDDLLGLGLSVAPSPPPLKLSPKPALDPASFQKKWAKLAVSLSKVIFYAIFFFLMILSYLNFYIFFYHSR